MLHPSVAPVPRRMRNEFVPRSSFGIKRRGWPLLLYLLAGCSRHVRSFLLHLNTLTVRQQVYLAIVIYSYAIHLRRGTYRTLPLSRSVPLTAGPYSGIPDEDDIDGSDDAEAFYRVPLRNGTSVAASGWRTKTGVPRDTRSIAARMEAGLDAQDVLFDEDEGDLSSTADDSSRPRSRAQNQR
jgi:hypothetical protein